MQAPNRLGDVGELEPPLGVRPTLPAARGSSQLAAIAESLVTDAERSNRRVTCLLHISLMVRVCVMLRVLPSQSSVRSLLALLLYKQRCLSCLARPVRGTIGRCSVFKNYLYGYENKEFFHCINTETVP